jgi:feruloyl esterase
MKPTTTPRARPSSTILTLATLLTASLTLLNACSSQDTATAVQTSATQGSGSPVGALALAKSCDTSSLATLPLNQAKVVSASLVTAGSYTPAGTTSALTALPAFCRITGVATPTPDSLIKFELWVPADQWNGKLVATGNGGYSPALSYGDMAYAMREGYAVLGGDSGHQSPAPNDMMFAVGHPEKIIDWGTRSVHAITVPGKQILSDLMDRPPSQSYYYGCSTGGHQAYAEVQRYPEDFDGVIAGDPGNNRVALNAEFLWRFLANHAANDNSTPLLTPAKVAMVTRAAIAACDSLDGVSDGVIADPRACTSAKFNVDSLKCTGSDNASCLTPPQLLALKKIYRGPVNPVTHSQIYPGPVVGSESSWASYWGTTVPVRADFWRYWAFNEPNWNWWAFDYDRDYNAALAKLGPMVDQNNPDISAFKAHGGKLITYQGWADPVVNPLDTIAYYDKVRTLQGSQQSVDAFFRLFMVPGMGHCSGGVGQTNFGNQGAPAPVVDAAHDLLTALDQWVTHGAAPASITAAEIKDGAVHSTRPLCSYPKRAVYNGSGDSHLASNFSCG